MASYGAGQYGTGTYANLSSGGSQTLNGVLFQKAPSFLGGVIASGSILTGVLYQNTATFNPGAANLTGFDLEGYRFRFDDGTETTATWAFFPDQPITAGTPRRLRVLINTTGDEPSTSFSLQFRQVGDPDSEWETVTT